MSPLASGTYTLTAKLDDGTALVTSAATETITVAAGHNAAPIVTVSTPNGGESYYGDRPATDASYGSLVGPSVNEAPCTSFKRVTPGQPDQSYLIFKLQGSGACFSGRQMPSEAPVLPPALLQLFRDWIANGAPNN